MTRALRGSYALALLLSVGCSTSTGSTPPDNPMGSVGGNGNAGGYSNMGGGFHLSGGSTSNGTGDPLTPETGCAAQSEPAKLTQVNILFLLDKSGSMGDQLNADGTYAWQHCESRWNPVATTLKEFFSDADSSRIYASLSFLPADGDAYAMCTASKYSTGSTSIKVPLTLLDATGRQKFLDKLCDCGAGITPASTCIKQEGGTPTLPALQGTIDYAATVAAKYPQSKTVIVMLTDGEPGFGFVFNGSQKGIVSCNDLPPKDCTSGCGCIDTDSCNTEDLAAAEVEKVRRAIEAAPANSIYVAGVGDISTATLDAWATASGNDAINLLDMTGPEAAATLRARLEAIRTSSISCEFTVPIPATGQIDSGKTNVSYTPGGGSAKYLNRTFDGTSASCGTAMDSWYFDNPDLPKTIKLCPETCKALQTDPKGEIQVVFGCTTVVRIN